MTSFLCFGAEGSISRQYLVIVLIVRLDQDALLGSTHNSCKV